MQIFKPIKCQYLVKCINGFAIQSYEVYQKYGLHMIKTLYNMLNVFIKLVWLTVSCMLSAIKTKFVVL